MLEGFVPELGDKALHADLGSYLEKSGRLEELAAWIAGAAGFGDAVAGGARRAARLAKADLVTEMVGEFPELQGTVGRIYAELDGEEQAVADAVEGHYRPRGPGDALPEGPVSCALALAEKVDDLVGFFAVAGAPSGSADPFGLRRQALGLLRICFERHVRMDVFEALGRAAELLGDVVDDRTLCEVVEFVKERLYRLLVDEGFRYDLVRAALEARPWFRDLPDFRKRVESLALMSTKAWWPRLVEVVQRTENIYEGPPRDVNTDLFVESEEIALFVAIVETEIAFSGCRAAGDHLGAGRVFAEGLAEPLHDFFEHVLVNAEEPELRANRHAMLGRVHLMFSEQIARLTGAEAAGG
jgi:glycyl-tRNA synthetase beta chain